MNPFINEPREDNYPAWYQLTPIRQEAILDSITQHILDKDEFEWADGTVINRRKCMDEFLQEDAAIVFALMVIDGEIDSDKANDYFAPYVRKEVEDAFITNEYPPLLHDWSDFYVDDKED